MVGQLAEPGGSGGIGHLDAVVVVEEQQAGIAVVPVRREVSLESHALHLGKFVGERCEHVHLSRRKGGSSGFAIHHDCAPHACVADAHGPQLVTEPVATATVEVRAGRSARAGGTPARVGKLPELADVRVVEPDLRQARARAAVQGVVDPPVDGNPGCRVEPDDGHPVEGHGAT